MALTPPQASLAEEGRPQMKIWTRQRQLLRLVGVVAAVAVAVSEAGVGAGLGMLPAQAQAEGAGAGARVPMPLPVRLNQPHRLTRRAAALRRARRRAAVSWKSWCMLPAWLRSALLSLAQAFMSVVTITILVTHAYLHCQLSQYSSPMMDVSCNRCFPLQAADFWRTNH